MATSFLQFGSEEEDKDEEIDEEVVVFMKNLSMNPKTWLDFPEFDAIDSELSDAQEEHILAIVRLVPVLTDLKNELCPSRMTEGHFWTIYFVLLVPRFDKDKGELLSSPQIMKAREMLLEASHTKLSNQPEKPGWKLSDAVVPIVREPSMEEKVILPIHTEEHLTHALDAQIIDKTVTEEELTADKSAACLRRKLMRQLRVLVEWTQVGLVKWRWMYLLVT